MRQLRCLGTEILALENTTVLRQFGHCCSGRQLRKSRNKARIRVENVIIAGLAIVKFVHLSALMLLFGCGAFPLYAKKTDGVLRGHLRVLVLTSAITALISGVLWFAFP